MSPLAIILIVLLVLLIAGGGYGGWRGRVTSPADDGYGAGVVGLLLIVLLVLLAFRGGGCDRENKGREADRDNGRAINQKHDALTGRDPKYRQVSFC